ncbi:MAG: endonuclease domain-containing protein [Pseudomonadota bacterium]
MPTNIDLFVGEKDQQLTPPQSPLVRGEEDVSKRFVGAGANTPPLTRGGREGLGFLPYDPKLTALARENRKNPTAAEQKIWFGVLRLRQFSAYKFLRQKPIDRFIVDFYCASLHWVIEIDGDSHAEDVAYDADRTHILQRYGLTVIRYGNHDVMHNISGVYDDLLRRIS